MKSRDGFGSFGFREFPTVQGTTYRIVVDSRFEAGGSYTLTGVHLDNDAFVDATVSRALPAR